MASGGVRGVWIAATLIAFALPGCSRFRRPVPAGSGGQVVVASWYGPRFDGRTTASGERFDQDELTAAHPSLPFGSRVLVTNLANGRSVTVRINDRGPRHPGRALDLSRAAARRLGIERRGTARVRIRVLDAAD
jgi:rare lipoprotein A